MIKSDARNGRYVLGLVILVLLGLGVLAWLERATLLAWFHVRMLVTASDENREARAARVAQLGDAAVPGLLDYLQREEPAVCFNARTGLTALVRQSGGLSETRTTDLVTGMSREFAHFSRVGQRQSLEMVADWFQGDPGAAVVPGLILACGRLLTASLSVPDADVQSAALQLCLALVSQPQGTEVLSTGRELVRACLQARDPEVRIKAIQVGLHPGMDLLEAVAGLLQDSEASVRRVAVMAVGPPPAGNYVLDEALLPCLHDSDPEVRQLTEAVLRLRGLGPQQLELGRLLTDPLPARRMRVLEHLPRAADLDHKLWLSRLSQDPAPSVRAATIRVMADEPAGVGLTERLEQMAQSDPSPTVCYLAGYYLKMARSRHSSQDTGSGKPTP